MSGPTQVQACSDSLFVYRTITLCRHTFQSVQLRYQMLYACPTTPRVNSWFRLFPLRSPLLRESLLISSPPLTEMSHFSGSRSVSLCIQLHGDKILVLSGFPIRKSPGHSFFPAHRSLSQVTRPSSPSNAKASTSSP